MTKLTKGCISHRFLVRCYRMEPEVLRLKMTRCMYVCACVCFCVSVGSWGPLECLDLTAGGVMALIILTRTHTVAEQEVSELHDAKM